MLKSSYNFSEVARQLGYNSGFYFSGFVMDKFASIRPYNDDEVANVIDDVINDDECVSAVLRLKLPNVPAFLSPLLKPFVRYKLRQQMQDVKTVDDVQAKLECFVAHMIDVSVDHFSVSGLDKLDPNKAYLFVSNHRDITLDPAFVNFSLFGAKFSTVRIAIGDNLLSKDFVSHLMRINKSFIVKRSETAPRKILAAFKLLSEYIAHSIKEDNHPVWIAQREGRAKDGIDKTEPSILKMFAIHAGKKADFAETLKSLNIVPVSISYEYDPCDEMKANELNEIAEHGSYEKSEHEDITSIAQGIAGFKGNVHLSYGEPLDIDFDDAESLAQWLDEKIISSYVLHPSNFFAYHKLYGNYPALPCSAEHVIFDEANYQKQKAVFFDRIANLPEKLQNIVLNTYANPVVKRLELSA